MTDSNRPETLDAKRDRNREQRIEAIKRWVAYIETHEPDEWGEQQNRLVNSQLEAARQSGVDVDRRRRVKRAGRTFSK